MSPSTLDASRVDPLLQFIIVVAGQQDEPRDRELGPIHLLKYAYLADLRHAEIHEGQTFTKALWRFHHFGPWSPAVLERIEPALNAVGATKRLVPSDKYEDYARYSLRDERLLDRLDASLPSAVVSAVRHAVGEFGSDTASLLRHVYLTTPILRAAPREHLVFEKEGAPAAFAQQGPIAALAAKTVAEPYSEDETAVLASTVRETPPEVAPPATPKLSWRARKERRERLLRRRDEIRARLAEATARPREGTSPAPRYDEVYFEGLKLLDELAGPPPSPMEAEAQFSDDIWKSPTRSDPDVP